MRTILAALACLVLACGESVEAPEPTEDPGPSLQVVGSQLTLTRYGDQHHEDVWSFTMVEGPCHPDMYHQTASKSLKNVRVRFTSETRYEYDSDASSKYCDGTILSSGGDWMGDSYDLFGDSLIALNGHDDYSLMRIEALSDEGHIVRLTGEAAKEWTYCYQEGGVEVGYDCIEERTVHDTSRVVFQAK